MNGLVEEYPKEAMPISLNMKKQSRKRTSSKPTGQLTFRVGQVDDCCMGRREYESELSFFVEQVRK